MNSFKMTTNKSYQATALLLFLLPMFSICWKWSNGHFSTDKLIPETAYQVEMNFTIDSTTAGKEVFVKSFLPKSNQHQTILHESARMGQMNFKSYTLENAGKKGEWRGYVKAGQKIGYAFKYEGKALKYQISNDLPISSNLPTQVFSYLEPEEHIQSDDLRIVGLADILSGEEIGLKSAVQSLYEFVRMMPSIKTSELTDALTALSQDKASCNGKSRLLVALCRARGIPARVVGGVILEDVQKRTSHLWAEVWMGNQWVPFDALNGHFAFLPANYMQLYTGDYFLIAHTPNAFFDYNFSIEKEKYFTAKKAGFLSLWSLIETNKIPIGMLKVILLLPLCALIVGIFKNVIGLKTIGVFLPAIIAVSLDSIGPAFGLFAFLMVVLVVSLLHIPLDKWGILYAPKLIIMLTGVVICLLAFTKAGISMEHKSLSAIIFFPIIVLTIAAEKFARTIIEEGFSDALKLQAQTLLLTLMCYLVFSAEFLVGYFLTFPETYAMIIGLLLFLGRWIGLRMTEYFRFGALVVS